MDVGAIPSSAIYGPSVAAAGQVPRRSGAVSTSQGSSQGGGTPAAGSTTPPGAQAARASQGSNADGSNTASSQTSSPHVKFTESDGTRVMNVYNSKDVLIYQLPPKGSLTLIHNAESERNSQVKTSA